MGMSVVAPLAVLHARTARAATHVSTVTAAGVTGDQLGVAAGIVAAIVGVGALALQNAANNRQRDREHEQEIFDAEGRGEKRMADQLRPLLSSAQRDSEFWRALYFAEHPHVPPPAPPSATSPADGGPIV